jgi:multiple sugar transport system substrate-binding protein
MKENLLRFMVIALLISFTLVGCYPSPSASDTADSTIITIKLSTWTANPIEQKLLKQVLRDFEAKHPNIKVKQEVINDQYMDVIKTRLVGEAAADVFYLDVFEAPFLMSQGILEPLDSYITPEFGIEDFEETLLNSFKYDNQIFGLPKDYSTLALFYNKKALTKAGLANPPINWEELRSYSKALTIDRNQDKRIDQYGFGETPELARQVYKIKAFGGKIVDDNNYAVFASESALQGLQLVVDQYLKDRTSAQKSDVGTNSGSEMLGQEKAAMVIEGNWAIPFLQETFPKLEFATAELPTLNEKKGTMVFTVAYVMNKQSQNKKAAWELISYLTGKEGMSKWTGTGIALPTRKSVAQELGYEKDLLRSAFVAGVDYATPWQIGKYPAAIMNNFDNQFVSAMLGQQPLAEAMRKAEMSANKQIKAME